MVSNHRFILLYARKEKNTSEIFAKEKILKELRSLSSILREKLR